MDLKFAHRFNKARCTARNLLIELLGDLSDYKWTYRSPDIELQVHIKSSSSTVCPAAATQHSSLSLPPSLFPCLFRPRGGGKAKLPPSLTPGGRWKASLSPSPACSNEEVVLRPPAQHNLSSHRLTSLDWLSNYLTGKKIRTDPQSKFI